VEVRDPLGDDPDFKRWMRAAAVAERDIENAINGTVECGDAGEEDVTKASAAPCEEELTAKGLADHAGRMHVIVCEERDSGMMVVARWVVRPGAAPVFEGGVIQDGVRGLAFLDRVVKAERERRGL
jgi:hypothetical protein